MTMRPKRTVKIPLRKPPRRAAPKVRAAVAEDDGDIEDYEAEAEPNMRFSHALFVVLVLHVIAVAGVFAFNSIKAGQSGAFSKEAAAPAPVEKPSGTVAKANESQTVAGRTHTVAAGDTLTKLAGIYNTSIEAIERENGISTYSLIRVGQVLKIPEAGKDILPASLPENLPSAEKQAIPAPAITKPQTPSAPSVSATPVAPAQAPPAAGRATPEPTTKPANAEVYVVAKGDNPYSIAKKLNVSYKALIEVNGIDDPTKIQIGQKLKVPKPAQ